MAYVSQDRKKQLSGGIKAVLKKYNVKGTISVYHHSSLVVTLKSGAVDFGDAKTVNPYWIAEHFQGVAKDFLLELKDAMNVGNHDRSDIMTDYFDVGWYIDINIGKWEKPYVLTA